MDEIEIPLRILIKKHLFFPNQSIPKCDQRLFFSRITNLLILLVTLVSLSFLINWFVYYLLKKDNVQFEVTTFCTKYMGQFSEDIYMFNGVPYAVSPTLMKFSVKDVLKRQLSQTSLRWFRTVQLNSIETCYASHANQCNFNNSVWRCINNKLHKRCINFENDVTPHTNSSESYSTESFDEDCLYLNIKVPKSKPLQSPVIVFIAGTNYATDISNKMGKNYPFEPSGRFINDVNAIFVSLSYRLGPFGTFFDHNLKVTNFVISDLLVGIHWIKLNIHKYGGDPNKIVLLAHGTGATLGLSILLQTSNLFQSAWLASGSVHIPKQNEFYKSVLRDLLIMIDKRCLSNSYYHRFCKKRFAELLLVSAGNIVLNTAKHYQPDKCLNSLLDINFMKKQKQPQQPFLTVDFHNIIDSPSNLIYKNVLPSIPIVFTSMLSELNGFPGERQWNFKPTQIIEKEFSNLFQFLFQLSKVPNSASKGQSIFSKIKNTEKINKKSMAQIALEIFSLLKVTCPINSFARDVRKLKKNIILNFVHAEPPTLPVGGMIFPKTLKRFPFYGYDMILLFGKEETFTKKLDNRNKAYQLKFRKFFKEFVHGKNLDEIKKMNLVKENIYELNNEGLHPFPNQGYIELCDKLNYNILNDFLNKIN